MEYLRDYLRKMDFATIGNGGFSGVSAAALPRLIKSKAFIVDLRTKEEAAALSLPFTHHIPINELPDRLDEVPVDVPVILFSNGPWRSSVAFAYLTAKGFVEVSAITHGLKEMLKYLKPGPLFAAGVQKQTYYYPKNGHVTQNQSCCCCG